MKRFLNRHKCICWLMLGWIIGFRMSPAMAGEPVTALWLTDHKYVFSTKVKNPDRMPPTANISVTLKDGNGQAVAAGTPIALSIYYGYLTGNTLFKVDSSDQANLWGGGNFYFYTEAGGVVHAQYKPDWFGGQFSNLKNSYPDSSEEAVWRIFDQNNRLSYYKSPSWVHKVAFTDPANDKTAYLNGGLSLDSGSVLPVLVGPEFYSFQMLGAHGEPFVFAAATIKPERDTATIQVFDARKRPVPPGTPVMLELAYGRFVGNNLVQADIDDSGPNYDQCFDYANREGGRFVFYTQDQGKISATYQAPQTTPPPFTAWATGWINTWGWSMDQAWKNYALAKFEFNGSTVYGYGILKEAVAPTVGTYTGKFEPANMYLRADTTKSILPALVGPDRASIQTTSAHGDRFVFVSPTFSESARIDVQVFDSRGFPVPENTPVVMALRDRPQHFTYPLGGRLYGKSIVYAEEGIFDEGLYYLRVGKDGKASVLYQAPRIAMYSVENLDTFIQRNTVVQPFLSVANYGPEIYQTSSHWFTARDDSRCTNYAITLYSDDSLPVLIGPQKASVTFKPAELGFGRIFSMARIKVQDFRGYPVPAGASVWLSVSPGTVMDASSARAEVTQEGGVLTAPYLSPTRAFYADYNATLNVVNARPDMPSGGHLLGSGKIHLSGPAVNTQDYRLGKVLLGFSVVDFLKDLNPLKAIGSLKRYTQKATDLGEKYRNLLDKTWKGTATQADFDQYQNGWRNVRDAIIELAQDVPGTSVTGPSLAAGQTVKSFAVNGLRHVILHTAKEKLIKEPLKKAAFQFVKMKIDKYFQKSGQPKTSHENLSELQSEVPPFFDLGKLSLTSDIYTVAANSGMYEMYGLSFQIDYPEALDSLITLGVLQEGDQGPLLERLLPGSVSVFSYGHQPVLSPGLLELTRFDKQSHRITGAAIGFIYRLPGEIPWISVAKVIHSQGDTLTWLDGTRVIVPANAVADSALFFLNRIAPPSPLIAKDSLVIQRAYAFGSLDADSVIQKVLLSAPGQMATIDTAADGSQGDLMPYLWNDSQGQWVPINPSHYSDSELTFSFQGTGIYGFAEKTALRNEPPILSSIADTTIQPGDSLSLPFSATDPEGEPVTLFVTSSAPQVSAAIQDTLLKIHADVGWQGSATVTLFASDGIDTSFASFNIVVAVPSGVDGSIPGIPKSFQLFQNYPNPFNPATTIRYALPKATHVELKIYDILGHVIRTLEDGQLEAGYHSVKWDGRNDRGQEVGSGIYFYRIVTPEYVRTQKLTKLK